MNQHRFFNALWALLLIGLLAACTQPTPTPPPATSAPEAKAPLLQIIGPEGTKTLTLTDLKAFPVTEGRGGTKSSTGKITLPDTYTGVALKDLVAILGTFSPDMGINVVAEDGYGITFSYDQVINGTFVIYDPGTGDELTTPAPMTAILAYARNGAALDPKGDGTLRLMIVGAEGDQVTDGHWSVKWVNQLEIKSLGQEWTLHLEGARVEDMDRATFESGAAPNCHAATWTDDHGQRWVGMPLWRLVGRVDDEIKHDGPAFNDTLADTGYTLDVIAADGYAATFDIARIKRNNEIIVAFQVNDNPLPEKYFPLRLVGDELQKNEMIGQIAQIIVHIADSPAPTATPEPTAVPEPVTVEGDLIIIGLVNHPLGLSEADLQAMDVIQITAEHPKKGQQEYSGIYLNALLDQAGPQESATTLIATADDGFASEIALSDVRDCNDCLLAFTNTPGKFKLVMPDLPSNVWVKGIVQIEIK